MDRLGVYVCGGRPQCRRRYHPSRARCRRPGAPAGASARRGPWRTPGADRTTATSGGGRDASGFLRQGQVGTRPSWRAESLPTMALLNIIPRTYPRADASLFRAADPAEMFSIHPVFIPPKKYPATSSPRLHLGPIAGDEALLDNGGDASMTLCPQPGRPLLCGEHVIGLLQVTRRLPTGAPMRCGSGRTRGQRMPRRGTPRPAQ